MAKPVTTMVRPPGLAAADDATGRFHASLLKFAFVAIPVIGLTEMSLILLADGQSWRWYVYVALWMLVLWQLSRPRPNGSWLLLPVVIYLGVGSFTDAWGVDIGTPDSATNLTVMISLFAYHTVLLATSPVWFRIMAAVWIGASAAATAVADGLAADDLAVRVLVTMLLGVVGSEFVRRLQQALRSAVVVQGEAADRLAALVADKDRLVASVSHELRTPLTAILGFAEAIDDSADQIPAEVAQYLGVIRDEARDMADIIEDLLVAARAEMGTLVVKREMFALAPVSLAVLESTRVRTLSEERTVRTDIHDVWALADPLRTRQIIRNLVTNALRYGGDEVEVSVRVEGAEAVVAVADDGAPLDLAEEGQIFEAYYTARQTPTQSGSVGLGLAVSRQLARLMDGDVSVERVDHRTVFCLRLPLAPVEAPVEMAS